MDIGIPFDLSATAVPLVQDLVDIVLGAPPRLMLNLAELRPTDVVTAMEFVAKRNVGDSNIAPTTIIKSITTSLSASGVIAPTRDPSVWSAYFLFTVPESIRLERFPRFYSVTATVTRDAVSNLRVVQTGTIQANETALDVVAPLADGTYRADGSLFANGLPT